MTLSGSFCLFSDLKKKKKERRKKEKNKPKGELYKPQCLCESEPGSTSLWIFGSSKTKGAAQENNIPELCQGLDLERFCFDCRHLGWHCFSLSVPFIRCLDLGTLGLYSAPRLCTSRAPKCFRRTLGSTLCWWVRRPRKQVQTIPVNLATPPGLHAYVALMGPQALGLADGGHPLGGFLFPALSCLPKDGDCQRKGQCQEVDENSGSPWKWEFGLQS